MTNQPQDGRARHGEVLCLGEALIDVVSREGQQTAEHVGGSPLNVASVLASMGHEPTICAWWGDDERGHRIAQYAADHGVAVAPGSGGAERTTVAYAELDHEGRATYTFDLLWEVPELAHLDRVSHLHTGSIAATLEPGGSQVVEAVKAVRANGTISYDPNVRPAIMGSPEQVLERVENLVALSDVVKASDEDVEWLYPGVPVEQVMRKWVAMGPGLVVVTRGPWGAYALLSNNRDLLVVDQLTVELADTVGAGDSFMGGLLSGLLDAGLAGSRDAADRLREANWDAVQPALHRAVITSGLTVSHHGAHAPTREDVLAVHDREPSMRH